MVSVRMNFYQYREEVRKAIIQEIARLDSEWDPFAASWLAYALSQDGFGANQSLLELIKRLDLWAEEDVIWRIRRNLGALCFLAYFVHKMKNEKALDFTNRVLQEIERLLEDQKGHKFSPGNDPEQVFPIALLVRSLEEAPQHLVDLLRKSAQEGLKGPLKRRLLYQAALRELDEAVSLPTVSTEDAVDPGDIIALVWYWERYESQRERAKWWGAFESIKEQLSFGQNGGREGARVLSPTEMALLYEAVTLETATPDPNLLFELYRLHPRIKEIAASLYKNGEYPNAVEEATKALNAFIQEKTGCRKAEAELVQSVMKNLPKPTLELTPYLETDSGRNEQAGLALIAEGVFKAFRNPKAHSPKDAPQVQIDALEALDQLVIISYVFKRVERAEVDP